MTARVKRWRPRFSLRTFLIAWMVIGGSVAWLSIAWHDYRLEQNVISELKSRRTPNELIEVTKADGSTAVTGMTMM